MSSETLPEDEHTLERLNILSRNRSQNKKNLQRLKMLHRLEAALAYEETEDKMFRIFKRMQRKRFQKVNKLKMIIKLHNFKVF